MSYERPISGGGPGAEPAPVPVPSEVDPGQHQRGAVAEISAPMRLQVLSTEHWSLGRAQTQHEVLFPPPDPG